MDTSLLLWAAIALAGFILGLWVRAAVLLRIAIGLFMLGGLALLLGNTAGWQGLAYWSGAAMVAIAVIFGVAIVGALAARLVRRMVRGAPEAPQRMREHNSIID